MYSQVKIFMFDRSCFLPSLLFFKFYMRTMGSIPHLETQHIKKASLHLKQAFLEIFLLPPARLLRMEDNSGNSLSSLLTYKGPVSSHPSSRLTALYSQLPLAPSHFVQCCLREIVQWGQLSTFLCHSKQSSALFIYSSSVGQPLKKN